MVPSLHSLYSSLSSSLAPMSSANSSLLSVPAFYVLIICTPRSRTIPSSVCVCVCVYVCVGGRGGSVSPAVLNSSFRVKFAMAVSVLSLR